MKIGIISDTHDNIQMTEKACEVFKSKNVNYIIHCGDLTSPEIIKLFRNFKCKFVIGNSDKDINEINKQCKIFGFDCSQESSDFEIEGKRFLLLHGNVVSTFREAVASGKYDFIIKGHTHYFEDYIKNNSRIINPGSLFGSEEYTIAILDIESGEIEKIVLESKIIYPKQIIKE